MTVLTDDDNDPDLDPPTPDEVAANRRVWLAALRSNNYAQGRHVLRNHDNYCCLGVAEDTLDCTWTPSIDRGSFVASHGGTGSATGLTTRAMHLLGLRSTWVAAWVPTHASWQPVTLVNLNDDLGFTLAQIAAVIEDQGEEWVGTNTQAVAEVNRRDRDRRPAPPWTPRIRIPQTEETEETP